MTLKQMDPGYLGHNSFRHNLYMEISINFMIIDYILSAVYTNSITLTTFCISCIKNKTCATVLSWPPASQMQCMYACKSMA